MPSGAPEPWIWVCHHAPPRDSPVSWGGKRSYGDQELSDWIAEFLPTLVLSGHVHQAPFVSGGRWVDRIEDTWVFNMGRQLGEAPTHVIIDTEAGGGGVVLAGGPGSGSPCATGSPRRNGSPICRSGSEPRVGLS